MTLRLAAVFWFALAAPGPAAGQERVQGDLFVNTRYGIEITKPSAWHFLTAGMVYELARKSGGGKSLRGGEDPVKLAGFAVIVTKSGTLGETVDPQVIVLVQEVARRPQNLVQVCEELRSGMSDPEIVTPGREVRLGDKPAARLDFRGIVDGALVRATALCVFKDRQAFLVVGQAQSADFERELGVFQQILGSFRLR